MTVIVFPGQGSQYVGMAKDFYENFESARDIFNIVEDQTSIKIKDIIFNDTNSQLNITQYTQLAIFCSSLAIFKVMEEEIDLTKAMVTTMLGHSLGEYTALTAAGLISTEDCSSLLKVRGELMQNAYEPNKSGMVAIIGLSCDSVDNIINDNNLNVEVANDNSFNQIVVSGTIKDLQLSENFFFNNGAKRYVFLNVSAAFHSKLMINAENQMKKHIDKCVFKDSNISIISNFSGDIAKDNKILINNLSNQMSNRVRWVESIKLLDKYKKHKVIEIGPGKVLSGLIKRISNNFEMLNIENISDLEKFND